MMAEMTITTNKSSLARRMRWRIGLELRLRQSMLNADCYSQYFGQSWKNVISIGDSDFERQGTRDVVKQWCTDNARTAYQLPRTKTVKLLDDPSCEDISLQ